MSASIKRIGPKPPELNREYKKRPKPVTGHGKYIKVLETVYKPPKMYEFPPETPERRQRIIESQRKAREKREQEEKPKRETQKRIWTPERVEEFKRLHAEGLTYAEMADAMHMRKSQINAEAHLLRSNGELPNRIPRDVWSDKEIETLHRMRAEGISCAKIGLAMGRSTYSVEARLRREDEKKWLN